MDKQQRTFFQKQDGSVILETAMMLTVILILTFGMVDFGRVMYTSNSLISAAREGVASGRCSFAESHQHCVDRDTVGASPI